MNVDQALIDRCIKQDRKAHYELYRMCYGYMMSICLRYKKNDEDAKSLVNQAFLKICQKIELYEGKSAFKSWVRRITVNLIIDEFRKEKKHLENLEYADFDHMPPTQANHSLNEGAQQLDAESLRAMIRTLPETSQQIFNLCVLDGYTYEEVSKELNISEATCRWHVFNSRKVLREMIETEASIDKKLVS